MDFKGQALFDVLSWLLVAVLGAIAFIVGYTQQEFALMAKIFGGAPS